MIILRVKYITHQEFIWKKIKVLLKKLCLNVKIPEQESQRIKDKSY